MTDREGQAALDWADNSRAYTLAWGLPSVMIVIGAFLPVPGRTALWVFALLWKGTACLVNARRCGRTHCRYTGPFYLLLIPPVLLAGLGLFAYSPYAWWGLGLLALLGGKVVRWATERAWGRYNGGIG